MPYPRAQSVWFQPDRRITSGAWAVFANWAVPKGGFGSFWLGFLFGPVLFIFGPV